VLLMYLWSALVCGSALAIGVIDGWLVAGAIVAGAIILFLVTALPRLLDRRRNVVTNGTMVDGRPAGSSETSPPAPATSVPTNERAPGAKSVDPKAS
jgi:hypothetical protein